jgi:hypothetical protein
MKCFDKYVDLKSKSKAETIHILRKERNRFAQSRQAWIKAAFLLKSGDPSEFNNLVSEELCTNCLNHYESL